LHALESTAAISAPTGELQLDSSIVKASRASEGQVEPGRSPGASSLRKINANGAELGPLETIENARQKLAALAEA
jgi:hypothetical protein